MSFSDMRFGSVPILFCASAWNGSIAIVETKSGMRFGGFNIYLIIYFVKLVLLKPVSKNFRHSAYEKNEDQY